MDRQESDPGKNHMNTTKKDQKAYQELKIDPRIKLAVLWTALMFCYTYADILGFFAPGNLAELLAGEIAGIQMTQGLLLGSAVLMLVPTLMIALSVFLRGGSTAGPTSWQGSSTWSCWSPPSSPGATRLTTCSSPLSRRACWFGS
jgi:hypothetical protein